MLSFRLDKKTEQWKVCGPTSEIRVGEVEVTKKNGQTKTVNVSSLSSSFLVDGVPYCYGTIGEGGVTKAPERQSSEHTANHALEVLQKRDAWTSTPHLTSLLGMPKTSNSSVISVMNRLRDAGKVERFGIGKFRWRILVDSWDKANPFAPHNGENHHQTNGHTTAQVPMIVPQTPTINEEEINNKINQAVTSAVQKLLDAAEKVRKEKEAASVITVKIGNNEPIKLQGTIHKSFTRCLRLATARRHILMIGPAGCGKSHLAHQIADALQLPYSHCSCSAGMSEGQLLGRLIPGQGGEFKYIRSDFVKSYEEGGVFLFDEIDAADANVLLIINSALANGHLSVPNRPENPVAIRHKDFVAIAAANTYGTGADRLYVGRNQLDESTLDRFRVGQIEMDYDEAIENKLCPNDNLRNLLQNYRKLARQAKLRRVISTRFLQDAQIMLDAGDSIQEIESSLFAGWTTDELHKIGR